MDTARYTAIRTEARKRIEQRADLNEGSDETETVVFESVDELLEFIQKDK